MWLTPGLELYLMSQRLVTSRLEYTLSPGLSHNAFQGTRSRESTLCTRQYTYQLLVMQYHGMAFSIMSWHYILWHDKLPCGSCITALAGSALASSANCIRMQQNNNDYRHGHNNLAYQARLGKAAGTRLHACPCPQLHALHSPRHFGCLL